MRGCVDVWTYGIIIISCILNKINFHNLQSTAFKTQKEINIRDSNVVPHRSTKPDPNMLNFAEQTGSGVVMLVWSIPTRAVVGSILFYK